MAHVEAALDRLAMIDLATKPDDGCGYLVATARLTFRRSAAGARGGGPGIPGTPHGGVVEARWAERADASPTIAAIGWGEPTTVREGPRGGVGLKRLREASAVVRLSRLRRCC